MESLYQKIYDFAYPSTYIRCPASVAMYLHMWESAGGCGDTPQVGIMHYWMTTAHGAGLYVRKGNEDYDKRH